MDFAAGLMPRECEGQALSKKLFFSFYSFFLSFPHKKPQEGWNFSEVVAAYTDSLTSVRCELWIIPPSNLNTSS